MVAGRSREMNSNGPAAADTTRDGEPVAGGSTDQRRVRLHADAQPVLGHQPGRERVVRHDQLFAGLVDPAGGDDAGLEERVPHAARQFGRRLAGEGQPEHLLRPDGARAHQPDHAGGHHRRLARAGAGDDHAGLQRGGDGLQLLVGERNAERRRQVLRPDAAAGSGAGRTMDAHQATTWTTDGLRRAAAAERAVAAGRARAGRRIARPGSVRPRRAAVGAPRSAARPAPARPPRRSVRDRERDVVQRGLGKDLRQDSPGVRQAEIDEFGTAGTGVRSGHVRERPGLDRELVHARVGPAPPRRRHAARSCPS